MTIFNDLFITKKIFDVLDESNSNDLKRELGAVDLTLIGVGGIIGTGIFVLTGNIAANYAGPAIVLSFLIAGGAAGLAALCYAELSSMIPVSGSAYTYAYATLGEVIAWIIGWDLILEVSVGLSGYIISFFEDALQVEIPKYFVQPAFSYSNVGLQLSGNIINLPAAAMSMTVAYILTRGIKESVRFNSAAVIIKVLVIVIFIIAALPFVDTRNWTPFIPENKGKFGEFGLSGTHLISSYNHSGIIQGATFVFFSFIGFDSVSTTAQECKNPQRDLPIGILSSLAICTVLYIIVSFLLTGLVPYNTLNVPHPIALAIKATGLVWLQLIVELGAIFGLTSVLLVGMMSQPRILLAMSQDGLLPPIFGSISPKTHVPVFSTYLTGTCCALLSAFFSIDFLGEMTSVGTLFAFFIVCVAVIVLRIKQPDAERKFKVPFGPWIIPLSGAITSLLLIFTGTRQTIFRLFLWMFIGLLFYTFYGYRNSRLRNSIPRTEALEEEKYALNPM